MQITVLRCKIHRARVTGADLNYEGSIALDPHLIAQAGLHLHEKVDIYNITNGERFSTYVISAERYGEGTVALNGAAARKVQPGDLVIICAYGQIEEGEAHSHNPVIILMDDLNQPQKKPNPAGDLNETGEPLS